MNGARLCTRDELEADCTIGTGCYKTDQLVWSSNMFQDVELDRNDPPIQISCDGRKVGFQIDPAQINVEDWIGAKLTVEMGKINTAGIESPSNVFDMNGNPIARNVKFEKTVGNIDLDQASTSFTVTLKQMSNCADVSSEVCLGEIKDKIQSLLKLSNNDYNRIEVETVSDASTNGSGESVSARIRILPADTTRRLRHQGGISATVSNTKHSVGLFRALKSAVEAEQGNAGRVLDATGAESSKMDAMIVNIKDMKILPSDSDMKLVTTDPELKEEEEELYHYGSMKGDDDIRVSQPILNKVERKAMVDEIEKKERSMVEEMKEESKSREEDMMNKIDSKSKSREEIMMNEMKEESKHREEIMMNEMKNAINTLHFELVAVTLACVGISLVAFLSLRHH